MRTQNKPSLLALSLAVAAVIAAPSVFAQSVNAKAGVRAQVQLTPAVPATPSAE